MIKNKEIFGFTLEPEGFQNYNLRERNIYILLRYSSFLFQTRVFIMADTAHQCTIVGIAGPLLRVKILLPSTLYRELRAQVGDHNIGVIPEDLLLS